MKAVLTAGTATATYTRSRILSIDHVEEPLTHWASIVLNNSDKALNAGYAGYQLDLSYGLQAASALYSQCAPLWVKSEDFDSRPGKLTWRAYAIGLPDRMQRDRANDGYTVPDDSSDSVKTLVSALLDANGATTGIGSVFNHCANVSYTWAVSTDSTLVTTLVPKDSITVVRGESRLAVIRRLLQPTTTRFRFTNDGKITFLVPTMSGSTYDATFELQVDSEIIRPNAAGDETNIAIATSPGAHWEQVDEAVADDADWVESGSTVWVRDLYNLGALTAANSVMGISGVKVWGRILRQLADEQYKLCLKDSTNSQTVHESPAVIPTLSFANYSYTWNRNPNTNKPWTTAEIASLQAGVSFLGAGMKCSQLYVEVLLRPHQFYFRHRNERLVQPNYIEVRTREADAAATTGTVKTQANIGASQLQIENLATAGVLLKGSSFFVGAQTAEYTITGHATIAAASISVNFTPTLAASALFAQTVQVTVGQYNFAFNSASTILEEKRAYHEMPLTNTAQASSVAEAILDGHELWNPIGSLAAPQHAGLEVLDYIQIIDERENPTMFGNVGRVQRVYNRKSSQVVISLGNGNMTDFRHVADMSQADLYIAQAAAIEREENLEWMRQRVSRNMTYTEERRLNLQPVESKPAAPEVESFLYHEYYDDD